MFILRTHTGKEIQLGWGTYAMYLFCEKQKTDLRGFSEQIAQLQFSIPVMVALLQSAVLAAKGKEPSTEEVCDLIDECGGILATSGPLIDFAAYIVDKTVVKTSENEVVEEKKSPSNP